MRALLLLAALAALPPPARAQAAAPAPRPAAPPAAVAADDFDLLAPAPAADPAARAHAEELTRKLALRRSLLGKHQLLGFLNLGAVATATVLGQLNYTDKYGGGGDTEKFRLAHRVAAYSAAGLFAATGLLALLAPSPLEKPARLDTATLHKAAMLAATAGMAAQVVLGVLALRSEGNLRQRDLALAHQVTGYATLAATAAGVAVLTF